ncbi:hypothetical protein LCGC14_0759750 [marine sediment metagenome]|uniref:Uncharacterized protein n=1 Tax=marine sediment metagenome TaxID=412755 RepID=A0A0F9Q1K2_9ZZZZ
MANDQASYRTLIDQILATAVDSSTWTDAIKDDALRHALSIYDHIPVTETSFTVTGTKEKQDLSTITAIHKIIAVAYPWADAASFSELQRPFRHIDDLTIYFEDIEPVISKIIRVRHTTLHAIKDLDSAAATTIPVRHTRIIALLGAAAACQLRLRQLSENPAIPASATRTLESTSEWLSAQANELLQAIRIPTTPPNWSAIGL